MTRRHIAWAGLLLLSLALTPVLSQNAEGQRYALLVGVNEYHHTGFRNLEFAANDARELADLLKANGYEAVLQTNRQATLEQVRGQLKSLLAKRGRHDLVLVALAGHGLQFDDGGYFCPHDAEPHDPKSM